MHEAGTARRGSPLEVTTCYAEVIYFVEVGVRLEIGHWFC